MTNLKFENLPSETIEEVKSTLAAYDRVFVIRENGEYSVRTGVMLKREYAEDHATLEVTAEEVFNENEMMLNYINTFRSFPVEYRGERDWGMIGTLQSYSHAEDSGCPVVKMDENGNFYI